MKNFTTFILFFTISLAACGTARADEFAAVAAGDPMYGQLSAITKAGWLSAAPTSNTPHLLTRYEIALETAKAIFMVTARHRADAAWAPTAPRPALRALRDLTASLRAELKTLDVEATSTLALLDTLLKPAPVLTRSAPITAGGLGSANSGARSPTPLRLGQRPGTAASMSSMLNSMSGETRSRLTRTPVVDIPLSQRLRLTTTLLALARDTDAAFGDAVMQPSLSGDNPAVVSAGAEWAVTDWLSLRADYRRRLLASNSLSARVDPLGNLTENRMGGGVDIALPHNLTFSGNLARVSDDASRSLKATRLEGGVGFTTWQDRVSLTANLSRLVPEDSLALSSTAAGLNVDVDVTERLSLSLLYKQLFGPQVTTHSDRFVGGGISINF